MHYAFYLCAALGIGLIISGIIALVYVRRAIRAGVAKQDSRWFRLAFFTGCLLVCSVPWQLYPYDGGTMLGFPFFAAWFDARGRDFIGVLTLPSLIANAAVWFLFPHLALGCILRCRR